MITRCYLEITNVCNLNCVFCPKTTRTKHTMTLDEFDTLTDRLAGEVKFLYFHRSEERRVGKGVDLGGRRIIKKKKEENK